MTSRILTASFYPNVSAAQGVAEKKEKEGKNKRNNLKIGNKVANFKLNIEERDYFCEGGRFDPLTTCE